MLRHKNSRLSARMLGKGGHPGTSIEQEITEQTEDTTLLFSVLSVAFCSFFVLRSSILYPRSSNLLLARLQNQKPIKSAGPIVAGCLKSMETAIGKWLVGGGSVAGV